jgi:nucleotide-binding universal stress UspA family protein
MERNIFEKVLVCLDGSTLAEQVLPNLIEPFVRLNSTVIFMRVVATNITIPALQSIHIPPLGASRGRKMSPVSDIGETDVMEPKFEPQLQEIEREQAAASDYLERIAEPLRKRGIRPILVFPQGDIGQTIIHYSQKHKVSLIALTTHGSGGATRAAPGKIAQFVLAASKIPVLVVMPQP